MNVENARQKTGSSASKSIGLQVALAAIIFVAIGFVSSYLISRYLICDPESFGMDFLLVGMVIFTILMKIFIGRD